MNPDPSLPTQGYNADTASWVPGRQATVFPSAREAIAVAPQESGVRIEYIGDPGIPKWRWIDGDWVSGVRKFRRFRDDWDNDAALDDFLGTT